MKQLYYYKFIIYKAWTADFQLEEPLRLRFVELDVQGFQLGVVQLIFVIKRPTGKKEENNDISDWAVVDYFSWYKEY